MLDPADSRKFKGSACCKKPKLTLFIYRVSNDLNLSDQHMSDDYLLPKIMVGVGARCLPLWKTGFYWPVRRGIKVTGIVLPTKYTPAGTGV